jgi:hypothetical protein
MWLCALTDAVAVYCNISKSEKRFVELAKWPHVPRVHNLFGEVAVQ